MERLRDKEAELINDLVMINTDRIESFAKAVEGLDTDKDADAIAILEKLGQQSQQFKSQLAPFADQQHAGAVEGSSQSQGALYQLWTRQYREIDREGRKGILIACNEKEEVFEKVYGNVLDSVSQIDEKIVQMIKSQLEVQRQAHQVLKEIALRQ